jgi:hypothetical protein
MSTFTVGRFTLEQEPRDLAAEHDSKLWLRTKNGEGMELDPKRFEEMLALFYGRKLLNPNKAKHMAKGVEPTCRYGHGQLIQCQL